MILRRTSVLAVVATAVTLSSCTTGSDGGTAATDLPETTAAQTPAAQGTSQGTSAPATSSTSTATAAPSSTRNDETLPAATGVPTPSAPDPCRLITKADIDAVLGPGVGKGESDQIGLFQSCTYQTPDDAAKYFDVTVQARSVDKDTFVEAVEAEQKTTGIVPTKLAGPGELAYDASGTLSLWARGVQVTVLVTPPDGVDAMAVQRALGTKAVPRLQD